MTDREMLELAARAAGIVSVKPELDSKKHGICIGKRTMQWLTVYEEPVKYWNPRKHDGDALRLAVKLEFEIDITSTGVAVRTRCGLKVLVNKTEEPDLCAAARLAITRAAAEIGRQMEE